jgi:putative FmdB family regulatory protein
MPIYEYKCNECGDEFEKLIFDASKDNPPCPSCGSKHTTRKVSAFGSVSSGGTSCGTSGFS